MNDESLTAADVDLFEQAKAMLTKAHHGERHQVAAAVRTRTGAVYLGLHIGSRRVNVCAESSAIANAQMAADADITQVVAVCKDSAGRVVVTNPCGVCRELMGTYCPDADIIIDLRGAVRKVPSKTLMPEPWMFPHENSWTVGDPTSEGN